MNTNHADRHGSLEFLRGGHSGPCRAYRPGQGYISKTGAYTEKVKKAVVFHGPGEAIAMAQVMGFAILTW